MKVLLHKQPPSADIIASKLRFWSRWAKTYREGYYSTGALFLLGIVLCLFLMFSSYIPLKALQGKLPDIIEIFVMSAIPLIVMAILRHLCLMKVWDYTPSEAAKAVNTRHILDPKHEGYSEVNAYLSAVEQQKRWLTNAEVQQIIKRLDLSPVGRLRA